MAKKIQPLKNAPELPEEVTGSIESEEVLELNDKVDGPIDDKLADLLEEATESKPAKVETAPLEEQNTEAKQADETDADGLPDDPETSRAIDEIVAEEGDTVLAAEDFVKGTEEDEPDRKQGRFKAWLGALWKSPRARWTALIIVLAAVIAAGLVPTSRYFVLNTAGVRSSLSVRVIDGGTLQPLKNVSVSAGGAQALTDSGGMAKLEEVRLGQTTLRIEKRAFAPHTRDITVGWGSNPLGEFQATAIGSQYTFLVKDAFSGLPIGGAEASSGDGNASSDEEGKLVLTLDTAEEDDAAQLSVSISAGSYRTETIMITVSNKETQSVSMVPARRHVFVSKRSGNYDVYAVDVDGKNEKRLVSGTGLERDDIALVPHPTDNTAALVSTRENARNQSGYLLSTLYIMSTADGSLVKIDQSEQIKIVGWSGDGRLVYAKIAAGASGTDPKRHRLMSFNDRDDTNKELASSNSFNDVVMAGSFVYYASSNIFQETTPAMNAIKPDGSGNQTILDKEVYTIIRSGYDMLHLSAGNEWYQYVLGSPMAAKSQSPSSQRGRVYLDSPAGKFSLWIDDRDGKGVLINYDKAANEEKTLHERGGLKLPAYWLNDKYVIFRIADGRETADYVMNLDGGEPQKIIDVTDTSGVGRWFYY